MLKAQWDSEAKKTEQVVYSLAAADIRARYTPAVRDQTFLETALETPKEEALLGDHSSTWTKSCFQKGAQRDYPL